jgi:hypothetical protein
MNLREEILKEHSRAQRIKIEEWVGDSPQRFDELFRLFAGKEPTVVQRASWPLSYIVEKHPEWMNNKFEELISKLQEPHLHDAVKRNGVRLLQYVDIPVEYQGAIMNICFGYVESPREAVAIKAFSLTVLGSLATQYPDIIPEIKLLVQDQLPHQTAAFVSRAKKLLKTL